MRCRINNNDLHLTYVKDAIATLPISAFSCFWRGSFRTRVEVYAMWITSTHSNPFPALVFSMFLGMGLLANTPAEAGRAADLTKTITCTGVPVGTETTTLKIDLERFSIPAWWDDSGSGYEISTHYKLAVFLEGKAKTSFCFNAGNWGTRDFPMFNMSSGDRWTYPLGFWLIVKNVPVNGRAALSVFMKEEDDFPISNQDDFLDLNPLPNGVSIKLNVYIEKMHKWLGL